MSPFPRFSLLRNRCASPSAPGKPLGAALKVREQVEPDGRGDEIAGGSGEEEASLDYLWWPPHKISARYLVPLL